MEQTFTGAGLRLPVTVVASGPNLVTFLRREDKDGYWAVQIGFGTRKIKNTPKPLLGHLQKALKNRKTEEQTELPRFLKETKISAEEAGTLQPGDSINPSQVLKAGDIVAVTGTSKGKGFAGVVKRWHFAGGPKTHGQSDRLRAPGSIGQRQTPGRVYKGKKMAGRMGGGQVTVKNLIVLSVDDASGKVQLSGPVPGSRGSLLVIKKVGEMDKPHQLFGSPSVEEAPHQAQENPEAAIQEIAETKPEEVKDGSQE